jgi:hypothetical protein
MTLEQWSYQDNRNDSVHGGSLGSDIEVISSFPSDSDLNRERVARWKEAFEKSYGLSYDFLRQKINDIPDKVRLVCNRRASVLHVTDWQNHQNNIVDKANAIIKEWCQNLNDPDLFKGPWPKLSLPKSKKSGIRYHVSLTYTSRALLSYYQLAGFLLRCIYDSWGFEFLKNVGR